MANEIFDNACVHLQGTYKLAIFLITVAVAVLIAIYVNLVSRVDVVYTHLFYIPIILAAILYHRKAVYLALFFGILHILINYYTTRSFEYEPVLRAIIFLTIAYIIGSIVEKKDQLCDVLKSSEDRLRRMYDTLETRIQERTIELNTANEGLRTEVAEHKKTEEALLRSKAQAELYVDIMGHDISNMNQAIMGYLEMAQEARSAGENGNEHISRSIELVKNSSRLIDNVKKLQRINAGEIPAEKVDLGELLSQTAEKYACPGDRDIKIDFSPAAGCTIMADGLVRDVFVNIIDNAIKHSRGPLTVNVTLDRVRANSRDCCRVVIADNGPGLPDELKRKLSRKIDSSEIRAERRGLGLYMVKMLVGRLGGEMRIEDRVVGDYTKGTRFVILLPACNHRSLN